MGRFGGFTETNCDELIARRSSRLARCSEKDEALFPTLLGHNTQRRMRDRVMASIGSKMRWNSETNQLPRPFTELIQIDSKTTATSLKFNALVAPSSQCDETELYEKRKEGFN